MGTEKLQKTTKALETHRLSNDENLNTLLKSVVGEVTAHAERLFEQIKKLSDIGRALSGVYDLNTLLEMIVDQAKDRKIGARGLRAIMEKFMLQIMYELPSLDNVDSCIITDDVILKKSQPIYKKLRKTA